MNADDPIRVARMDAGREALCRAVLDDLPEWFGVASARDAYARAAADLPSFSAHDGPEPVGFASVKIHTAFAAEMHVLGVRRRWHGRGAGRALVEAARSFAASEGLRFLTVKTLAPSRPDPNYAATRLFYERMGFVPVEIFPTLWSAANPCLLMIRAV